MEAPTRICLLCEGISPTSRTDCSACGAPLLPVDAVHFPIRRGEQDAANPLLGLVVDGKYRIDGVLGKGGMGTVFRATHQVSLVPVALKLLKPRFSAKERYRRYFVAEAQKAGRVLHENTARILDVGEAEEGTVYIAMELVAGATLHDCIYNDPPLTPRQVVDILIQICDALSAAHQVGLVHRDLSSRNVMVLEREGEPAVKVLDFGIAKGMPPPSEGVSPSAPNEDPVGFASPPYSAPEHLAGGSVDSRADLYSLGVIAYEALTRELPWLGVAHGDTARQLAQATLQGQPRPLQAPAGTPASLVRLITRLLAREPDERPQTADEVLSELRRLRAAASSQLLQTAATILFALSVIVFILAHATRDQLHFSVQADSIVLMSSGETPPVQYLRSSNVTHLRFDYSGFDATGIHVEARRKGKPVAQLPTKVQVQGGVADLAPGAQLQSLLSGLRDLTRTEPVELVFRTRGGVVLGKARIQIDDDAPRVALRVPKDLTAGILLHRDPDYYLQLHIQKEGSPVQRLKLLCTDDKDTVLVNRVLPADDYSVPRRLDPIALLSDGQATATAVRDIRLRVVAEDRAGNRGESEELRFAGLDFHVPRIQSLRTEALTHDGREARLRLELSESEAELQVELKGPTVSHRLESEPDGGSGLLVRLTKDGTSGFESGRYELKVKDAAGNESPGYFAQLTFTTAETAARLELSKTVAGAGRARVVAPRELLWDGRQRRLGLRCNEIYAPARVVVRSLHEPRPDEALPRVRLEGTRPGHAVLRLGVPDVVSERGVFQIVVELARYRDASAPRVPVAYRVTVLPEPPILQLRALPDTELERSRSSYLRGLEDRRMFRREKGRLHPGDWDLSIDDTKLVRGWVYAGTTATDLTEHPLRFVERDRPKVDGGLPLQQGRNLVGVRMVDLLERPVEVRFGDRPAPSLQGGTDRQRQIKLVGDFRYYNRLLEPRPGVPIKVEHGEDTRVRVRSRYPFAATDEIQLLDLPGGPLKPTSRMMQGGVCVLEFELPFEALRNVASLAGHREDALRKSGVEFRVRAQLDTPAASPQNLFLEFVTVRSALQPITLADVMASATKQRRDLLADVGMVPVLARARKVADPVPLEMGRPLDFRPQPHLEVRDTADFYLQRDEVSRQLYWRVVEWFFATPAKGRPAVDRLLFFGDPQGAGRLTREGMVPVGLASDVTAFERILAQGPTRPVTGVTFYQAYVWTRMIGWLVTRDPDMFRLPLGVELEVAGYGMAPDGRLHAFPQARLQQVLATHRIASLGKASRWPPTRKEQDKGGDWVKQERGRIYGLDFGVREWVLDLPWLPQEQAAGQLRPLMSNYDLHLQQAVRFGANPDLRSIRGDLASRGVVRGRATGELSARSAPFTGVVHTLYMPRDGRGVFGSGSRDPKLKLVGFRLASGRSLMRKVRRR